jgi:hypothetical protein
MQHTEHGEKKSNLRGEEEFSTQTCGRRLLTQRTQRAQRGVNQNRGFDKE